MSTSPAMAGGLSLYNVGNPDGGLASAGYSARAQDASTVLTNPAGMTRLAGTQVLLGAQGLYGDVEFDLDRTSHTPSGGEGGKPLGWIPMGCSFVTHQLTPQVTVGFGLSGNFGLSEQYDDDWAGRYYLQEATLMGVSLLPSIAYRVNDQLSLGASLNAMYGIMETRLAVNNVNPSYGDGELYMEDKTWGWGYNLGVMYEFSSATRFGLTYTSEVKLDFKPKAEFSGIAPGLSSLLSARGLQDATINMDMYVPQSLMASVFHQVNDRWALLGSVGWQDWSRFGKIDVGVDSYDPHSLTTDLKYQDTYHAAVGAQYRWTKDYMFNFGLGYDSSFQDDAKGTPMLPVDASWRFGAGIQKEVPKGMGWGVGIEYLLGNSMDVDKQSAAQGDLQGSFDEVMVLCISGNLTWTF
jgi:long-chain fatty acid transport protein